MVCIYVGLSMEMINSIGVENAFLMNDKSDDSNEMIQRTDPS